MVRGKGRREVGEGREGSCRTQDPGGEESVSIRASDW